jgi:hypothetical protein
MEKRASNTFVAGLNTDRHPLTSQPTELIEAQNIDLVQVGQGYQLIVQKREGNLEVLIVPPAYDATHTYLIGEYCLSGGVAYKSIADANINHVPPNVTWWEAQASTSVPAGLKEGFIPLAIKELNNIAYIVSVKPGYSEVWNSTQSFPIGTYVLYNNNIYKSLSVATGHTPPAGTDAFWALQAWEPNVGELGTFPSPDYSLFKYEVGAAAGNTVTVGTPIWDPTQDQLDYNFMVVEDPNIDEEVVPEFGVTDHLLTVGFTITNTGLKADNFFFEYSGYNTGVDLYVNGVLYAYPTPYAIAPSATKTITLKVADPWAMVPEITFGNWVKVTTQNGPIDKTHTFNYTWHTRTVVDIYMDVPWVLGGVPGWETTGSTGSLSVTCEQMAAIQQGFTFNHRTNNGYFAKWNWDGAATYEIGNYVWNTFDGIKYRSVANGNFNHLPPNAGWWELAEDGDNRVPMSSVAYDPLWVLITSQGSDPRPPATVDYEVLGNIEPNGTAGDRYGLIVTQGRAWQSDDYGQRQISITISFTQNP